MNFLLLVVFCQVNEPVLGFDSVKIFDDGVNLVGEFHNGTAQYTIPLNRNDLQTGVIYLGSENEKDIELIHASPNWIIRFGDRGSEPEVFPCL